MLTFTPTRRSQPYRDQVGRPLTPQLSAMLLGRPLHMPNPIDQQRQMDRAVTLAELIRRRLADR